MVKIPLERVKRASGTLDKESEAPAIGRWF